MTSANMVQLEAYDSGDNVVVSKDSFEHLLNCLDNQRFVGETPPNGDALDMGVDEYRQVQIDIQHRIDDFSKQCRNILGRK